MEKKKRSSKDVSLNHFTTTGVKNCRLIHGLNGHHVRKIKIFTCEKLEPVKFVMSLLEKSDIT